MPTGTMHDVLHHLRRTVLLRAGGDLTDGQLLDCFLARRDEAAFEALMHRHGPMVLGVCRRLLANEHDAEDAFQAIFLVLARKAAAVVPRDLVGNWLYGVAYRTALKAKAVTARHRLMERQVTTMPEQLMEPNDGWHDLQPLLDQELERLPDKYRVPVVLCELEGRTRKEAARHLGIPEGTLSSRLATARKMLARRLTRHGLALSAGTLALALSQSAASACVPATLIGSTVTAATLFAASKATAGIISAEVAVLAEGVLKTMLLTKLKIATLFLLAVGIVGAGAGVVIHQTRASEQDAGGRARQEQALKEATALGSQQAEQDKNAGKENDKPDGNNRSDHVEGVLKAVDGTRGTITAITRLKGENVDQTLALAKDFSVVIAGKVATLTDLKAGMRVALYLDTDGKTVVRIKVLQGQQEKDGQNNNNDDGQKNQKNGDQKPSGQ